MSDRKEFLSKSILSKLISFIRVNDKWEIFHKHTMIVSCTSVSSVGKLTIVRHHVNRQLKTKRKNTQWARTQMLFADLIVRGQRTLLYHVYQTSEVENQIEF